jgi:hypothetical protein
MSWALNQDVKPAAAKLLLIVIANYADERDTAWPSKARLARDCSLDKSGVCRHLLTLEEQGFLTISTRSEEGANLTSLIKLNRERTPGGTSATNDDGTTGGTDATTPLSRQCDQGSRASASRVVAPVRHKPSLEPSIEPSVVQAKPKNIAQRLCEAIDADMAKYPGLVTCGIQTAWVRQGADIEIDIVPAIAAVTAKQRSKKSYYGVHKYSFNSC